MDFGIFLEPFSVWLIMGLIFVLAEFVLPGLVIIFFGVGAWVVAMILLFFKINLFWQISIFTSVSIITLVVLRKQLNKSEKSPAQNVDEFVNTPVEVKETIPANGYGKVYFKGAVWQATVDEEISIKAGTWVKIVGYEGIILKVKR